MVRNSENIKYDDLARHIYAQHRLAHPEWEHFDRITRKERDYWRALAQIAQENGSWPTERPEAAQAAEAAA